MAKSFCFHFIESSVTASEIESKFEIAREKDYLATDGVSVIPQGELDRMVRFRPVLIGDKEFQCVFESNLDESVKSDIIPGEYEGIYVPAFMQP